MTDHDVDRYSSAGGALARGAAQHLVMKPFIWSLVNVQTHGTENLDGLSAPFIAIANHSSHLDACLVMGALPRRLSKNLAAGAAADYFFDHWYKGLATRLFFNAYPVERKGLRNRKSLSGTLLGEGVPLLIFPEGTRSRNGGMTTFKPGVAALSISRNVPVLPMALVGAYAAMPFGATTPVQGRPPVHVAFGRPLKANPGEIAHQFTERLHRYVVELYDTTAQAHGMPTQADFIRAEVLRQEAIVHEWNEDDERDDLEEAMQRLAGEASAESTAAEGSAGSGASGGSAGSTASSESTAAGITKLLP